MIFVAVFILLFQLSSVFAQSFNFDFRYPSRYGYGPVSGISGAITTALNIVFGGIVEPIFNTLQFNFYGATKLALWIVLYMLFSAVLKKYFDKMNMQKKFSKIISAILALFSVVFIPTQTLDFLFRDLLGGFVGFLLLAAIVALPIYLLTKWSREHSDDRGINLFTALMFLVLVLVLTELNNQFVYAFNYGFVQSLTSLIVSFGVIVALILCIHRAYLGFRREGGNEETERHEVREERDELEGVKGLANNLVGLVNNLRQNIHNVSRAWQK